MQQASRTKLAIKNAKIGVFTQIANVVLAFIARTIFIQLLNEDYLGVNSLFSNILTVLSFAELGIGNAIVFSLYKPLAENDNDRIRSIMKLYAKAYRIVGTFVFAAGLCIIPFMDYIIKDAPDIKENLVVIYLLFLFNTSASYFFSYKKTLITADQKDYVVQIYTRVFQLIQVIAQCLFLLLTHQYLVYLAIQIICTFSTNLFLAYKANKLFPFLKSKNVPDLPKEDARSIFANIKAMFTYKFGSVILNGTDNIIISRIIGLDSVGYSANYFLLINSVTGIVGQAITSITASVGNLCVSNNKKQIKNVMHELLLMCSWIYGFIAIGFFVLANDFIDIWLGPQWKLSQAVVFAIIFSTYVNGVQFAAYTFRTAQGLFAQSKWVPMIAAVINIVLSVWWGNAIGLAGVYIATGVSRLLTTTVVDPWLVYKNNFNKKPFGYYAKYAVHFLCVAINGVIQWWLINLIPMTGIWGFAVKLCVLCVSANLVFLIMFGWTKEFNALSGRIVGKFISKKK